MLPWMVTRSHRQLLAIRVQFDVSAKNVAHWTIANKIRDALGTCQVGGGIVDDQTPGQKKISRKEQARVAVVVADMRRIMSRRRHHIDRSITDFDLSKAIRPIGKPKILFHMIQIGGNNFDVRQMLKLRISQSMIEVAVRMHDEKRNLSFAGRWKQTHYSLRHGHLFRIGNIAGIDK